MFPTSKMLLGMVSLTSSAVLGFREDGQVCIQNIGDSESSSWRRTGQVRGPLTLNGVAASFEAGSNSCSAALVCGGRENDVALYDCAVGSSAKEELQQVWTAQNVSQDKLHLRVPVFVTALAFLRPCSSPGAALILAGTGHKQVRIYDTLAGRRPVQDLDSSQHSPFRATCVTPGPEEHSVFVGDTAGNLLQFDLRTLRRVSSLQGGAGSLRQLSVRGRLLASAGLDRYLRLYDLQQPTPQLLGSAYLKNRLNRCELLEEEQREEEEEEEGGDRLEELQVSDDEEDELEELPVAGRRSRAFGEEDDEEEEEEQGQEGRNSIGRKHGSSRSAPVKSSRKKTMRRK